MPNRNLTKEELAVANELLAELRIKIQLLAADDVALLFAYRRKIAKELGYDERGKPMHRRLLKAKKMGEQSSLCAVCREPLPDKYVVLDRLSAMAGYTPENTRLICSRCDVKIQIGRRYGNNILD